MIVTPSTEFVATLEGAPTGLSGQLGVTIYDLTDTVIRARKTTGLVEVGTGTGVYTIALTSPAAPGQYAIVWDDGTPSPDDTSVEELTVAGAAPVTVPDPSAPQVSQLERLPHANAVLREVSTEGTTDDWDRTATAAPRWSGHVDAYLTDRRRIEYGGQTSTAAVERSVILPAGVDVSDGDTITLDCAGELIAGRVRVVEHRTPPPGLSGTLRVTLDLSD
jgi:hypothetical protein